jgi:hypothetical protein
MNNTAINPLIQSVVYNNYTTDYHFALCESFSGVQLFSNQIDKNIK